MGSRREKPEPTPPAADATGRQRIADLLSDDAWTFDDLRRELGIGPKQLEKELSHLERSLNARGQTLEVRPAMCRSCGARLAPRRERPFHAPRRCPKCKAERVHPPSYRIV